jgi:hypothetical protein
MRYRLRNLKLRVPMPERGQGVFFTADKAGETINPMDPYYARMIADGDLVPAETEPEEQPAQRHPAKKEA